MFFESINWDDVYNKKITPPLVPFILSQTSTDYFEEEFTAENPQLTPPDESMSSSSFQSLDQALIISLSLLLGPLKDYGELFKDFDSVASDW